eukprot:1658714-Rhodomonas_salina.1
MERWVDNFHDDVGITDKMRGLTVAFRTPQNFRVHQNPESECVALRFPLACAKFSFLIVLRGRNRLSNWRANDWEDQGSPVSFHPVQPVDYAMATPNSLTRPGEQRGAAVEPPEYELAFDPNAKKTVSCGGGSFWYKLSQLTPSVNA